MSSAERETLYVSGDSTGLLPPRASCSARESAKVKNPAQAELGRGTLWTHPLDLGSGGGGCAFGEDFADAANLGAYTFEFFFDVFVAAIDVVDAIND
jgi:hypothetical protein